MPPVVGAISEIVDEYEIKLENKNIAVIGHGKLVGEPTVWWLQNNSINPDIFEKSNDLKNLAGYDVLISGVGKPALIRGEFVKGGAVLFDAGTSTDAGVTRGDFEAASYKRASIYTPVPGGIGPITLAVLFENAVKSTCFSSSSTVR